jgi:phage FluMu protein Com
MEGMKKDPEIDLEIDLEIDSEIPIIKVKCSKCSNVEDIKINNDYDDQYPELQLAGEKNCTKCGKLLIVYISTYIEEDYEPGL